MQNYFYIAAGGALGSLTRYWVATVVANRMGTKLPYGTFLVNMSACLVLGFSLTLLDSRPEAHPAWRFLIPIGFIGAYSTFSTFEWETFAHLELGAFLLAGLYVALSCILGLAAVWCGVTLARVCS
ncbi:fluoride efflux transporter CrcB [Acidobacterium sp. S8]|uniref:fluoride efflux transporter CrcB n=1 Tax=Acidobacterium sp. S8 TaxID=1641854 RepID=UPI00131AAD3D|nr:fluoride efflux transporter CrcB [Acidobacterium sp. S8]